MKKYILLLFICFYSLAADAQTRKYIGNFSQLRQYYNPSLTGHDGSQLKTLYRNQWTGYEDAPKTIFASAELSLNDLKKSKGYQLNTTQNQYNGGGFQHGIGLLLLRETFGSYSETQVNLSYGAGISLSEKLRLRWGTAVTYTSLGLDGNKLTVDQENDPKYSRILGNNSRSGKLDLNLGLALTTNDFYIGYAMQDITQGKVHIAGDEFMEDLYERKHIGMAGYRAAVSPSLGLILNGLYQYDKADEGTIEGQLKAVYQDRFWAGGGYRSDMAYTITAGLKVNRLLISYLYEAPAGDAAAIDKSTNEVVLTYRLKSAAGHAANQRLTIW